MCILPPVQYLFLCTWKTSESDYVIFDIFKLSWNNSKIIIIMPLGKITAHLIKLLITQMNLYWIALFKNLLILCPSTCKWYWKGKACSKRRAHTPSALSALPFHSSVASHTAYPRALSKFGSLSCNGWQ